MISPITHVSPTLVTRKRTLTVTVLVAQSRLVNVHTYKINKIHSLQTTNIRNKSGLYLEDTLSKLD